MDSSIYSPHRRLAFNVICNQQFLWRITSLIQELKSFLDASSLDFIEQIIIAASVTDIEAL